MDRANKNRAAETERRRTLDATRRLSVLSSEAGRHVFRAETCRSGRVGRVGIPEPRCLRRYRRMYDMEHSKAEIRRGKGS